MKKLRSIIFYDSLEGSRLCLALHWLINLGFLTLWCIGVGIVSLYFGKVNYGPELFDSYFQYAGILMLNLFPVFVIAALAFLICNRVWPAVLSSGLITLVLALINHFKLLFRNDPLIATDISYISEAAQMGGQYNITITPVIAACFASVVAASVFSYFFMRARMHSPWPRLAALVLLAGASAGLYLGVYTNDSVYTFTSNLQVEFADGYQMNEWNETDKYCCRGFLYPLINSFSELHSDKPAGYSKSAAAEYFSQYESQDIPDDQKVNIISVMLEAYYDFSTYPDIFSFETDPYAFYHQLQEESLTGTLVTNIFAGGTIDTERCYITGSTQLYNYRANAGSYARYFSSQGYRTEFCHPGYGWFYNRQNVSEYLGFDSANFFEGRYKTEGDTGIMRDSQFFPDLAALYAQALTEDSPYFNFSVTYQNHGPYASDELYDKSTEYVSRGMHGGLTDESYNILNNYFWGIRITDDSLRDFIEELRSDKEPVIVVLFGDHKPWLGDNSTVYEELGLDLSCRDDESFYTYYDTQYLIWANDAAKEALGTDFTGDGGSFSPCFLMMRLFDQCGWKGDEYMQAERELYEMGVDVINASGRFRENGQLTTSLSEECKTALKKVLWMQYYRMKEG